MHLLAVKCFARIQHRANIEMNRTQKKNTNDVASHKTLNNNLNETSAIDPLIKFCTLHGRNASFSNEPVF